MVTDRAEREFETGKDESWFANINRTYDEYLELGTESIKRNRSYIDKVLSDAQQHDNARQATANLALQNAVDTANMVNKQALRHAEIAIDRQWNLDEVSHLSAGSTVAVDAIAAAVAAKVIEGLANK